MKTKNRIQQSKYLLTGFVMTLAAVLGAATYIETVNGIKWTYTVSNEEASVGGGSSSSTAVPSSTSGAIVIPSTLGGSPVTSIGNYAFYNCSRLTNVMISASVTKIGSYAFSGCSGLTDLTVSDSVLEIGIGAFSGCSGLEKISLPFVGARRGNSGGVASLFGYVFGQDSYSGAMEVRQYYVDSQGNDYWGTFYIPSSLHTMILTDETKLGDWAFNDCKMLRCVTLPDSVTSIGHAPFYGCLNLTKVTIPQYVCTYGMKTMFAPLYRQISNIVISEDVTSIEAYAFEDCSGIEDIVIPDSVTSIGVSAFSGCTNLVSVTIPQYVCTRGMALVFSSATQTITSVTISEGVTNICANAFSGCSKLTSVTIPTSVVNIGNEAFANTPFYVNQPDGLVVFNGIAYKMKGMCPDTVTIPRGITHIASSAFRGCNSLANITIPDSVVSIGDNAFNHCVTLTNIIFDGNAPSVGADAFSDINKECKGVVSRLASGWGTPISRQWNDLLIIYPWYKVEFDANGGKCSEVTRSINHGCVFGHLPTPERCGYEFLGWFSADNNGIGIQANDIALYDICVSARWVPNQYTVTFDANGGIDGWSKSMGCDTIIDAPTVAREGYTFKGWSPSVAVVVPASNVTYTAQWQINQYMVTFDANGGDGETNEKLDYGTMIVAPMVTRIGYTFKGWLPNVAATVPASNVTYTAQWMINRYTVTFDAKGGMCGTGATIIDHGAVVGDLPVPTRVNDTFLGWFTAAEGGEKVDSSLVVTEGMTLYAHWLTLEESLDVGEGVAFANSEGVHWRPILDPSAKVGDATARSGAIGDRTNTWLSAIVSGAGTMSFWCKVSCEHDDDNTFTWDRLMVYTNDVEVVEWRMDGETDWTRREVSFTGGENTVKWVYFKDRSISEGEDCAWVDGVTWTLADVAIDVGGGKSVLVPMDWIDAHSNIVIAVGGDKSAAMKSTAANGRKVWECYVLGLDPEKANDFKITSFPLKSDGTPDLSAIAFEPEQNQWNLSGATPKLKGKATLDAEWQDVPPGGNPSFRFFTVEVQMP